MMTRIGYSLATILFSLNLGSLVVAEDSGLPPARGSVFDDQNGNGVRDEGEPGLAGIAVSNQKEIVRTDTDGRWELPHDGDTVFFVIKPAGWRRLSTRINSHSSITSTSLRARPLRAIRGWPRPDRSRLRSISP